MVSSISRSLPAPAAQPPPPHYKSLLTPLLHRRFVNACIVCCGFCYLEAFIISDKSSLLWTLFPVAGIKCFLLLLFSAMPILMLRISQLHVDKRSYPSPFAAFQKAIGSFSTYTTIFTYALSSLVFTTLYLLSSSPDDQLGILVEGRSHERPRLNERFLYLIYFGIYLGFIQGIYHVTEDRARLVFPEKPIPSPQDAATEQLPLVVWNIGFMVFFGAVTGPFAYLPFRHAIWSWTLWIARRFYWLNRSAVLPSFPVGPGLFIRSAILAMMICLSTEVAHVAFVSFFVEDPFKNGKVVTDKSSDPNGSLVTGLRSTHAPLTNPIAFWELRFISENRADRRRSIFTDVDRKPQPTIWQQIVVECLRTVNEVEIKLSELLNPPKPAATATTPAPSTPTPSSNVATPPSIPMGSSEKLFVTSPASSPGNKFLAMIQSTQQGASPDSRSSPVAALRKHLPLPLPESLSAADSEISVVDSMKNTIIPLLRSPYGAPFRQTIQRITSGAIPNPRIPKDAISALGNMLVASLEEDDFGNVQRDVRGILESFCATLDTLNKYVKNPPLHWTDTEAREHPVKLEEPEQLIAQLNKTLHDITLAFEPFFETLGVPPTLRAKLPEV